MVLYFKSKDSTSTQNDKFIELFLYINIRKNIFLNHLYNDIDLVLKKKHFLIIKRHNQNYLHSPLCFINTFFYLASLTLLGKMKMIGLIGNGSWATAIAKILTDNNHQISWWMRNESAVKSLELNQQNYPYLSSITFDKDLIFPTSNLTTVFEQCDYIIVCVPSAYLVAILKDLTANQLKGKWIISAVKGILPETNQLLNAYLSDQFALSENDYITITGPCHAEEIAMERLSYLTFSCPDISKATTIAKLFDNEYLKTVVNEDIEGTQYAAVLKNIYAVGAGIAHGLGYRDNFLSVYVTNCYKEMYEFVESKCKGDHSLISSTYLGDLMVTCYSLHSRNRRFGMLLGQGYSIQAAITEMGMMAEGYNAAKGMNAILTNNNQNLRIVNEIYKVLWEFQIPKDAFKKIEKLLQ